MAKTIKLIVKQPKAFRLTLSEAVLATYTFRASLSQPNRNTGVLVEPTASIERLSTGVILHFTATNTNLDPNRKEALLSFQFINAQGVKVGEFKQVVTVLADYIP